VIIGVFVGAIAKMLMPGRDPGGVVITILLGIAGAALAGFIGRSFNFFHAGDAGPGVAASIIGAVVLLLTYHILSPRKMAPH